MLKHLMNGSSLLALACYDTDSTGTKTPAELARESIVVDVVKVDPVEGETNEQEEEKEEGEEEQEEEVKSEETAEEKATREAAVKEKAEAKEQRAKDRQQKRIDKVVAEAAADKRKIADLEAQLAAKPKEGLTEEEIATRAEKIAADKIAADDLKRRNDDFQKACDTLNKDALKLDKEFDDKIKEVTDDVGMIPGSMIAVLEEIDNGADILVFLADDADEYEKIFNLANRPAKMATALIRISDSIKEQKKIKPKPTSKVPPPLEVIKPGDTSSNTITGKETMEEYARKRNAQDAARRKERLGY